MSQYLKRSVIAICFCLALSSLPVLAQNCDDPNDPLGVGCGAASGLSGTDPRVITGRIINVVLALLGVIDVGLMVYAGFTWMTAGGNEDKVTTAKKTIWSSVIGLAIILSAYAISNFVLQELYTATTNTRTFP